MKKNNEDGENMNFKFYVNIINSDGNIFDCISHLIRNIFNEENENEIVIIYFYYFLYFILGIKNKN